MKKIYFVLIPFLFLFFLCFSFFFFDEEFSCISYKGTKIIPESELIYFDKLIFRNLHVDYLCYDKSKEISQCFLIRKNKLKTYELYNVLFQFCKTDLQVNANLKKTYRFYRESRKMPWFWNDDGYFDSLDGNPSDLIGIFHFSENNSLLYGETMKRSSSFFYYGDIKEKYTEKNLTSDIQ